MDLVQKQKIAEKIILIEDDDLLNEINTLAGLSDGDFWSKLPAAITDAINVAKSQLDNGEGIAHTEMMREVKARFLPK